MNTKFFGVTNRNKFLNELEKVLKEKFPDKKDVDEIINSIGQANGIASLDGSGKVPSEQLPSYVDDIIEVEDYAHLPEIGETGKIYVTLDTGTQYRWGGSEYIPLNENSIQGIGIKKIIKLSKIEYDALATKDINTIYLVTKGGLPTFSGLCLAPALLYYGANGFEIKDNDWNHNSYGSLKGTVEGSYYFNYQQLGEYFDSRGSSFDSNTQFIDNNGNKISFNGFNDWHLIDDNKLDFIRRDDPVSKRTGSSVNGESGKIYCEIELSDQTFDSHNLKGCLLFPDGLNFINENLTYFNNYNNFNLISTAELNLLISGGCVFLPSFGYYFKNISSWRGYGNSQYTAQKRILMGEYSSSTYSIDRTNFNPVILASVDAAVITTQLYLGSILIADSNLPNEIETLLASI